MEVDSEMIAALVEDTLYTTHPAMILNLRACVSSPAVKIPVSIAISHSRGYDRVMGQCGERLKHYDQGFSWP